MAPKQTFALDFGSASAEPVVSTIAELQKLPAHKWIPIEEIRGEETATITARQANWLRSQIAKRLHGTKVDFVLVAAEAEEPAS